MPRRSREEKVYTIKPLKWEAVSDYCLLAKFIFWELRVWTSKMHDGYWMFNAGSECMYGNYSKEKVIAKANNWCATALLKALRPVTTGSKARERRRKHD